jgi:hypothetical protein
MAATPDQLRALQMLGGSTAGYTVTAMLEHGFKDTPDNNCYDYGGRGLMV